MMPVLVWLYKNSKLEIKLVLITLAVLITLPAVSVVVLASSGVQLVGEALAAINPVTHVVELFDSNGNKIAELELTTNWPATGYVSDEFGTHEHWRQELGLGPHTGIDIAHENGLPGSPVTPFMSGTIISVDNIDDDACGKNVRVQHIHDITSIYCHLDSGIERETGTPVDVVDVLGYMGNTGTSTGVHVHFGVRVKGFLVNPRTFLINEPQPSSNLAPEF